MEIGSFLIGTLLLIGCIAPLIWIHINQNKKDSIFTAHCIDLAEKEGLSLGIMEVWNRDYFIGIDEVKRTLIYTRNVNGIPEYEIIPLDQIIAHKIVKEDRQWTVKGQTKSHIERLELHFKINGKPPKEVRLLFYDALKSMTLIGELDIIKKWDELIKKQLMPQRLS